MAHPTTGYFMLGFTFKVSFRVVYNMVVLKHFASWDIFSLGVLKHFDPKMYKGLELYQVIIYIFYTKSI